MLKIDGTSGVHAHSFHCDDPCHEATGAEIVNSMSPVQKIIKEHCCSACHDMKLINDLYSLEHRLGHRFITAGIARQRLTLFSDLEEKGIVNKWKKKPCTSKK